MLNVDRGRHAHYQKIANPKKICLLLYEKECTSSKWLLYWTSLEPYHPSWSTHVYEF